MDSPVPHARQEDDAGLILVLNAGSSSIKFSVFEKLTHGSLRAGAHGEVFGIGTHPYLTAADATGKKLSERPLSGGGHDSAIASIHDWFAQHSGGEAAFAAIGHRVVHGGPDFCEPVLIDEKVLARLEALIPLAPLHQPHHLAAIQAVMATAPHEEATFDLSARAWTRRRRSRTALSPTQFR